MLIECLENRPVTIDGRSMFDNIRINIIGHKHQLRAKMVYIDNADDIPLDIVVYNYSTPKLTIHNQGIEFDIDGEEYNRHIKFQVKISYNIFKRIWNIDGVINNQRVSLDVDKGRLVTTIDTIKTIITKQKGEKENGKV